MLVQCLFRPRRAGGEKEPRILGEGLWWRDVLGTHLEPIRGRCVRTRRVVRRCGRTTSPSRPALCLLPLPWPAWFPFSDWRLRVFRDGCGLCGYYMIGILRRECVRTGGTGKPASPTLCLKSGKGGALKVSWLFLTWEGGSNFPAYVAQLDSLFRLQLNLKFWWRTKKLSIKSWPINFREGLLG